MKLINSTSRIWAKLIAGLVIGGASAASAGDTRLSKFHGLAPEIKAALEKDGMPATKLIRERFAGQTIAKIKAYGKSKKLDEQAFLHTVWQAQIVGAQSVSPAIAWGLVHHCDIQGLEALKGANPDGLLKCMQETHGKFGGAGGALAGEDLTKWSTAAWVADAKAVSDGGAALVMSRSIPVGQIVNADQKILAAFRKKKWLDNVTVVENLSVSGQRDAFAKSNKFDNKEVDRHVANADFLRVKEVTPALAAWLWDTGVHNLGALGSANPADLLKKLEESNSASRPTAGTLTLEEVTTIIGSAKAMGQHL